MSTLLMLPLGAAVGAAEFATCGLLAAITRSAVRKTPISGDAWTAVTRSPLWRPWRQLAARVPWPAAVCSFAAAALVQEAVLRSAAFAVVPGGRAVRIVVSVIVQLVATIVPVRGAQDRSVAAVLAVVNGTAHALLYAAVPVVWPLVAAGTVFTSLAVL
ncbi:hypothetical protein NGB36_09120 [Streptomyces sp. RB6PN25]|uniref:Uncharacterized protein n=1 Tax=Streptomyces humicola TaxID=2953240 RepID=A0ABT1PSV3_9ACTN|nr:hypothetical protein [Streptomyces humicola]MCQ4080759.1 hypothetical protein [Streptomyces humicola]